MSNLANPLDTPLPQGAVMYHKNNEGGGPSRTQIIEQFRCTLIRLTYSDPLIGFIEASVRMANRKAAL